jgi:hypothetical protein
MSTPTMAYSTQISDEGREYCTVGTIPVLIAGEQLRAASNIHFLQALLCLGTYNVLHTTTDMAMIE